MKGPVFTVGLLAAVAQLTAFAFEMDTQVLGPAQNALFGMEVAVSEDTVAVGARYSPRVRGTTQISAGSVYVYAKGNDGWNYLQRLAPNDVTRTYAPERDFGFGTGISISGNVMAVAAPGRRDAQGRVGAVYIFARYGGRWSQRATLTVPPQANNEYPFGTSVALQGRTLVVGAREDNSQGPSNGGLAYVFESFGDRWVQRAKLRGADRLVYHHTSSVAIDGDTIATGGADSVHIFKRNGVAWNLEAVIRAATNGTWFGKSVSLLGDTLAVGAPTDGNGAAHIFTRVGSEWRLERRLRFGYRDEFGWKVSLNQGPEGLELLVGAPRFNREEYRYDTRRQGAAHLFVRRTEGWAHAQIFYAPPYATEGDRFGHGVDISGDTAIIGTPSRGLDQGSAYILDRTAAP